MELHDWRRDVATCLDKLRFSVLKSKRALAPETGRVRTPAAAFSFRRAFPPFGIARPPSRKRRKRTEQDSPLPQTRAACTKLQGR